MRRDASEESLVQNETLPEGCCAIAELQPQRTSRGLPVRACPECNEGVIEASSAVLPRRTVMIKIGTSGFSYEDWLGTVYPAGLPARDQLAFYAREFPTVESERHVLPRARRAHRSGVGA